AFLTFSSPRNPTGSAGRVVRRPACCPNLCVSVSLWPNFFWVLDCVCSLSVSSRILCVCYSRPRGAKLRFRHRSPQMHRVSRVHDRVQGGAPDSRRRESLLGENSRKRHVPRHAPLLLSCP